MLTDATPTVHHAFSVCPSHPGTQLPFLEAGDIIIDGGNSNYDDSIRRAKDLGEKGFLFVGSGVSGGEEGARYGPSIMPGGNPAVRSWCLGQNISCTVLLIEARHKLIC